MTGAPSSQDPETKESGFRDKRHARVAWISTSVTLATYIGLMIAVSLAPSLLTQPITSGSAVTNGIVLGAAIIIFLIAVAAIFTRWNNKLDENP